ncbi:hypothetical protein JD276_09910 [Leucobacter sp. CSA1]|uniref:Tetratricopeptide repeat protein n=1 Tax=Leucobacter chromiisoli TaxID=2796471 RepID=A0A934QA00_9MICO|nr:hypothetical protein [Leucobacter chromiisoli]MBK0419349.1 hypothetical protein [Leucobacter chromiisoli]
MTPRARSLVGVVVITALLLLYLVFVGVRALALLGSGSPLAVAMGVALVILPVLGAWALLRELSFGHRTHQLLDLLESEGLLPDEEVDTLPSGRPDRAQADALFPRYRAAAEADPGSWRAWMRLGIVYDACGDRKRARAAIRQAISCRRDEIRGESSDN